jgi:hypothetical protein
LNDIKQRLLDLREAMEEGTGEVISAMGDVPPVLMLADVCSALGLEDRERCEVLGTSGIEQRATVLGGTVRLARKANAR